MTANKTPKPNRQSFVKFIDITTRWEDNDSYRHINNVVYFSFFDTAVNQNLINNGVLDVESSSTVGLVIDNHCQYFDSISFPDLVSVGLSVIKIGTSSVQYSLGVFKNNQAEICALGTFTHVYVDRINNRPVPIPNEIRKVLQDIQVERK
jgi:acyl-CoA thioester hydrolase